MVWLDAGEDEKALTCFEEACTVDGANPSVHFCRTVALVKMSRFVEAISSVESVLGCRRGTVDDYILRAKIRWALGMVVHGNADMSKARELCPDHPEVVIYHKRCLGAAEELFAKATATADAGDDRAAVKLLDKVADVIPEDVKVPVVRAGCKRRLKDFVGALKDYDEAAFQHFQGVHIGKAALHNAAAVLHGSLKHTNHVSDTRTAGDNHGNDSEHNRTAREWARNDREAGTTDYIASRENDKRGGNTQHGAEKGAGTQDREANKLAGYGDGEGGQRLEQRLERGPHSSLLSAVTFRTVPRNINLENIEGELETQAEQERLASELRQKFRLAIPHAGSDPEYRWHDPQATHSGCSQPGSDREISTDETPTGQNWTDGEFSFADGGGVIAGEGVKDTGGEEGQERKREDVRREGRGDSSSVDEARYEEPSYITRQRCLVLNDWALDMFDRGEYGKAVSALDLAVEGDKSFARATERGLDSRFLLNRGDCHRSNGSAGRAAADYKRALEVEPGNWMVKTRLSLAHYLKGNLLFNKGLFQEAISELDAAIQYNWKVSAYYTSRGQALYFQGKAAEAHADYRKAVELDPGNEEAGRLSRQFDFGGSI
ncbi:unnamed protein product, partial [Sphacelaria rigidula]